ncbi:nucleotidyltransferase family protein [Pontibacter akesuensis]|uniref:glucose-1-phosphate thymidylyltransferase n=1 Tax=Pontibacter akesuensis TaxID=388950 RepID=A0A1I7KIN4_9BACT|nr:sugar phosphate nucleotidyltransferase [Pontibacter akesuensis]GHA80256.1 nucleotidyltransferase [Pontibacter akesuensis]SFU97308.1 glucose-1-phosphate thymidylyltransferase [Pontibacter akesuensis]
MPADIVGLIPAAGQGSRLAPIPCSKELFPVGFAAHPEHGAPHPKVVSQYLLEHMQRAGAAQVYFILRKGKWDIPDYFGDGSQLGLQLGYLIMQRPYGTPYSLDQSYGFVQGKQVVFGFPDILFTPEDAFAQLLQQQSETQADVVLGCFKVTDPSKWDVVDLAENGQVKHIIRKPAHSALIYGWAIACWGPRFTEFMHLYLQQEEAELYASGRELSVGEVVQAAIKEGLLVQSLCFDSGSCLDVGTPEDLRKAIKSLI